MWVCKKCGNEIYFDAEPSICHMNENMELDTSAVAVNAHCSVCEENIYLEMHTRQKIEEIAVYLCKESKREGE